MISSCLGVNNTRRSISFVSMAIDGAFRLSGLFPACKTLQVSVRPQDLCLHRGVQPL